MMENRRLGLVLLLICLVPFATAGCVTTYEMEVNGYLDKEYVRSLPSAKLPFSVFVVNNENADNPLLEREIAAKIARLLKEKGYRLASAEEGDFYVVFRYGIDRGPLEITSWEKHDRVDTYDPYTKMRSTKHVVTDSGVLSHQFYTRSLCIRVVDAQVLRKSGKTKVIWAGDTVSEGTSTDLRKVINYLLVATFDYFGRDTGKAVKVVLSEGNPRVKRVMNSWEGK